MKYQRLTENELLDLQVQAVGKKEVTLPHHIFEMLVANYRAFPGVVTWYCDSCDAQNIVELENA